jgi:pimeloyl-ACP methyl ester carboxylesterase
MASSSTMKSYTLAVQGGNLYYEVRGSGPVLLLMPGGPADATTFRRMENRLASEYTVVTYDPRGLSHSSDFDPADDARMVEIFADDVHRLLDRVGGGRACVFGSSGGAVIALELATRHPEQLDTVVAHEPPSPAFLPDTARVRTAMEDVCDTCASVGLWPAAEKFIALVGIPGGPPPAPEGEPTPEALEAAAMMQRNMQFFLGRYICNIASYEPDIAALKGCSCGIVPAVGSESVGQLAHNGGLGLAGLLGTEATVFPGDHGGFDGRADEFAQTLRTVLQSGRR